MLCIAGRLTGSTFNWFEPYIREFILGDVNNKEFVEDLSIDTKKVFATYEGFKKELGKIFREVDEKKTVIRKLM